MDKCPSDFISFVKICVFIQWLELILKRSDPTEKETSVEAFGSFLRVDNNWKFRGSQFVMQKPH